MQKNLNEGVVNDVSDEQGRCKNCQYWGNQAVRDAFGSRYCNSPRLLAVSSARDFNLPTQDSAALVSDDDGVLQTGPEFGCNQWLEKANLPDSSEIDRNNVVAM